MLRRIALLALIALAPRVSPLSVPPTPPDPRQAAVAAAASDPGPRAAAHDGNTARLVASPQPAMGNETDGSAHAEGKPRWGRPRKQPRPPHFGGPHASAA